MIVTIKPIQGTLPHQFISHVQNFILTFVVWPILSIWRSDTQIKFVWEYCCLKQRLFKVHFFISWCFYLSRSTIALFTIWFSFTDTGDSQDNMECEGPPHIWDDFCVIVMAAHFIIRLLLDEIDVSTY